MSSQGPVRVLVVDDHIAIRIGISHLIDAEHPLMCSVGAVATAAEALRQARDRQPHVVVLDVDLAGEDGLLLIPALQRSAPCAVVVLTSLADPRVALRAHQLGASACLSKTAPASELMRSILLAHDAGLSHATGHPLSAGSEMSRPLGTIHP